MKPSFWRNLLQWIFAGAIALLGGLALWRFLDRNNAQNANPSNYSLGNNDENPANKSIKRTLDWARACAQVAGVKAHDDDLTRELGEMIQTRKLCEFRDSAAAAAIDPRRKASVFGSDFFKAWMQDVTSSPGKKTEVSSPFLLDIAADGSLDSDKSSRVNKVFESEIKPHEHLVQLARWRQYSIARLRNLLDIADAASPLAGTSISKANRPFLGWAINGIDRQGVSSCLSTVKPWILEQWCPADIKTYNVVSHCITEMGAARRKKDALIKNIFRSDALRTGNEVLELLKKERELGMPDGLNPALKPAVEEVYTRIERLIREELKRDSEPKIDRAPPAKDTPEETAPKSSKNRTEKDNHR